MSEKQRLLSVDDDVRIQVKAADAVESRGCFECFKKKQEQEQDAEPAAPPPRTVGVVTLLTLIPALRFRVFLATVSAVFTGATMPVFAILFGNLFQNLATGVQSAVNNAAIGFVLLGVVAFVFMLVQTSQFGIVSEELSAHIRKMLFNALMEKDVEFCDVHSSGTLVSRLTTEQTILQNGVGEKVGMFLQQSSQSLIGVAIAFYYSWKLTLVLLAATPLLALGMALMTMFIQRSSRGSSDDFAAANSIATEVLGGFRTMVSFSREEYSKRLYADSLVAATKQGRYRAWLQGVGMGSTFFFLFFVYGLGLWYGSKLVFDGELDPGDLLTAFFGVVFAAMAVGQGGAQIADIAKARVAAGTVWEMLESPCKIDKNLAAGVVSADAKTSAGQVGLHFEDVHFAYPTRDQLEVISGVTLEAKPGEIVAIVGASGGGKSTLLQLLLRFYDPSAGRILVDGVDLRDYNLHALREQMGLVSQEPILFSLSIAENIRYGRLSAGHDEIVEAAKLANAHDFIVEQPDGYNTLVGEKGTQLSGGQKQRVALARAILKDPRYLLLDEATSALDAESESLVQAALNRLMKTRTTIVIAHRLSTIMDADKICVMVGGKIVEQGKHDDLLARGGAYHELIQRQTWTSEDFDRQAAQAVHDSDDDIDDE
jgi:ATP-binding cassette, subfamily B (MDR/TAP), member 1